MHIFFLGYPGTMGGANTECWHTAKLWRQHGIDVTFIPTWGRDQAMEDQLAAIGCRTVHAGSADEPGQRAGLCRLDRRRHVQLPRHALPQSCSRTCVCRLVWVNCMTFLFDERDRRLSQPRPGRGLRLPVGIPARRNWKSSSCLSATRTAMGHLIRGAFAFDEIPFAPAPHAAGRRRSSIGRLARPDLDKWSCNHWRDPGPRALRPAAGAGHGLERRPRPQMRPAAAVGRDVRAAANPRAPSFSAAATPCWD